MHYATSCLFKCSNTRGSLETNEDACRRRKNGEGIAERKGKGGNGVVSGSARVPTPFEFSPTVRVSLLTWRTEPYIAFINLRGHTFVIVVTLPKRRLNFARRVEHVMCTSRSIESNRLIGSEVQRNAASLCEVANFDRRVLSSLKIHVS